MIDYSQVSPVSQSLLGHTSEVLSVTFSPDSGLIASGSSDKTVKIWDSQSGKEIMTLKGHLEGVSSVAFAPNSKMIASASFDSTVVKLWDVQAGTETRTLRGHGKSVVSVAFSPDGNKVATAGSDGKTILWDSHTGEILRVLAGQARFYKAKCVVFSPDGKILVDGGEDGKLILWDVESGAKVKELIGNYSWVNSIAFTSDGNILACGCGGPGQEYWTRLWDVKTWDVKHTMVHQNTVWSVGFAPNGETLASGCGDRFGYLWDVQSGALQQRLEGHTRNVSSIAFSAAGEKLASASLDGTIRVWRFKEHSLQQATTPDRSSFTVLAEHEKSRPGDGPRRAALDDEPRSRGESTPDFVETQLTILKRSPSDDARGEAADALAQVGTAQKDLVVEALLDALKWDRSFSVKRHCIWTIKKIGDYSPAVLTVLKRTVTSGGSNESGDAIDCLGEFAQVSEDALDVLLSLLDHSDTEQRATFALARIGQASPKIVEAMTRCLSSSKDHVREVAMKYFQKPEHNSQAARETLKRLLLDRGSQEIATETLQVMGVDVNEELEKVAKPLNTASIIRGIMSGWLAVDPSRSFACTSSLQRIWGALVATLLLGVVGFALPKIASNLVTDIALGVVIIAGVVLCAWLSRCYKTLYLAGICIGVFLITFVISAFLFKDLHGSPTFLIVSFVCFPIFLAVDLLAQVPEYTFKLRVMTRDICSQCGRVMIDTSRDVLMAHDSHLGGGRVVREHSLSRVAGKRVCTVCNYEIGLNEISPLEIYNKLKSQVQMKKHA
jgi:WD40 repeat protein